MGLIVQVYTQTLEVNNLKYWELPVIKDVGFNFLQTKFGTTLLSDGEKAVLFDMMYG